MAANKPASRAYPMLITVLVVLLILAIALFVYGSMTNAIPQPKLPGNGIFALGTMLLYE